MTNKQDLGQIHTVSGLTKEIKDLLEEHYPFVWITGEISNFALPSSGHVYFSLKDDTAVIQCVMFRNQKKRLSFDPENGMMVTGLGRISLYEPRGSYQLIFEHMIPEGAGTLQIRFDELKRKLAQEGLFDAAHKKPIPYLPKKIGIITSPTGAVIRDIIHVSMRRFPTAHLEIIPVRVQGDGAEKEVVKAIEAFNRRLVPPEVIIVARGGGSLEDLAPFNSEAVARAVFNSEIPLISAVGHETDYTICDFAADLRAPTPSAAAELALPEKKVLKHTLLVWEERLFSALQHHIKKARERLNERNDRLKNPLTRVQDMRLKVDDLEMRLRSGMVRIVSSRRERLKWMERTLFSSTPQQHLFGLKDETQQLTIRLSNAVNHLMEQRRSHLGMAQSNLEVLSPMAVLDRGYSITRRRNDHRILRDVTETSHGEIVETILAKGKLLSEIKDRINP